jgi:hypothetical protein
MHVWSRKGLPASGHLNCMNHPSTDAHHYQYCLLLTKSPRIHEFAKGRSLALSNTVPTVPRKCVDDQYLDLRLGLCKLNFVGAVRYLELANIFYNHWPQVEMIR